MTAPHSLRTLLLDEIRDLYDAERQLVKALPKMARRSSSRELRTLIEAHLNETEGQVARLERAFELLNERPTSRRCAGIAGILEEESALLSQGLDGAVRDAAIIAGAQRAEHYEIGAYGTVIAWARRLGEDEIASLLHDTLDEEKDADAKLTALAESVINSEAAVADGGDPSGRHQAL